MNNLCAHRPLAALMLIVLTLALSLQLAQAGPGLAVAGAESMLMPSHCDDCVDTAPMPDCADGVCSAMMAMVGSDGPPGAFAAPSAEHARIPLYHPGPGTAPEPQPPRMPISV